MPLSAVIGHPRLMALLRTAVSHDRVPQSLLFAGPSGVGKRTVAIAVAQAVNCPNRPTSAERRAPSAGLHDDACGECVTCQRIARGHHTDVRVIEKGDEASIRIQRLRAELIEVIGYRPFEGRKRVFIIDPADDMTADAQSTLLKALEEPPPSAIIILVTAYPDTILPTILSRCRRLRFGPLADRDVARVLSERCGVDTAKARLLAAGAGGSVERALEEEAGDLEADREAALDVLQASSDRGLAPRLKASAALAQHKSKRRDREALSARLAFLASFCRDAAALRAGAPDAVANTDVLEALQALAATLGVDRLTRAFDTIQRAQQALERNASPKIVADWVSVSI